MVINIDTEDYMDWRISELSDIGKEYIKLVKNINSILKGKSYLNIGYHDMTISISYNLNMERVLSSKYFTRLKIINESLYGTVEYMKYDIPENKVELRKILDIIIIMCKKFKMDNVRVI